MLELVNNFQVERNKVYGEKALQGKFMEEKYLCLCSPGNISAASIITVSLMMTLNVLFYLFLFFKNHSNILILKTLNFFLNSQILRAFILGILKFDL